MTAREAASPFGVGSLVRVREREWVVLPGSDADLLMVRPLGGTDAETTGVLTSLEIVEPAAFARPDPSEPGDYRSARLLRDALRLGFRSSAGPFRSFGHIAVEPRPYQLVPLLMALRQDPVRLLIADDVGIGKTVEAGLIARELLDQGDAQRLAVLCPPHLAEQWQAELAEKFHLDATLVLASTAARLERGLPPGRSIFEEHPIVVVSLDYIKADRRRDDFLRACPKLVIVDEAHTCADQGEGRAAAHQRFTLVKGLAADPERHVILVTATPHSGKEGSFRSLLSLIDPDFANLPDDLSGDANRRHRERLARHLVQRRREDIRDFLGDTQFPERMEAEQTYQLSAEYRTLFDKVLAYARETVRDAAGGNHRQRVRWWSALALLRSLASSPAAAAATLRTRAASALTTTVAEADDVGRRMVLDLGDDESDAPDVVHGADPTDDEDESAATRSRRRLLGFAKEADALAGDSDEKLLRATTLVQRLLDDGFNPIVFCRFIPTAEYVAGQLRSRLKKSVEVVAVTGTVTSNERVARIEALAEHPKRVLVATDCLSEGINLQHAFDAVLHYDLPWNPTRLEQREGRVDRFGQEAPEVRVLTYYGDDNQIDEIVLEVLLRKHRVIRNTLGVSIPVPGSASNVIEALTEGVLLAEGTGGIADRLPGMDAFFRPSAEQLSIEWDNAAEKEKASRRLFAQAGIQVAEVAREVTEMQAAIGVGADVEAFTRTAIAAHGGRASAATPTEIDLAETPLGLREAVGPPEQFRASFDPTRKEGERYLSRTDPFVAGLASFVLDRALDAASGAVARRCGLVRTSAVVARTTLVLIRFRFHIVITKGGVETPLLAEDCGLVAWTGAADGPTWLTPDEISSLLAAEPNANPGGAIDFLTEAVDALDVVATRLDDEARERAKQLHEAHTRVREAAREKGVRVRVEPQLPVDVLGVYVYLPAPSGATR